MSIFSNIYLIRHGEPDSMDLLPKAGEDQVAEGARQLAALGVGGNALVLSSTKHYAKLSSDIVKKVLGINRWVNSLNVGHYGLYPEQLDRPNLPGFFSAELAWRFSKDQQQTDLVVVTHEPFIIAAQGLPQSIGSVAFGEVVTYEGHWMPPRPPLQPNWPD